ncbi:hypothetical protein JTE90_027015 [Oedothorax gibbosus]|uniref:Uncharacterized protein n=1 Tax=Oedothorax gibbosus TaxID=931172 RepID=A0AAV6VCB5_9ARAC|nr:hypothetical protein JTE90_027015 [Oedothorax gibbosus]
MGSKIFEKIHRSYELSNSTHINVVSFADIFEEISNDLQPFLKFGRYFSSRLTKNTRTKRETGKPITDVPELLLGYLEPALKELYSSATCMFSGNDNTLFSKVIMAVLLEIKNDEDSMLDVKKLSCWSSKVEFSPLMFDVLKRQSVDDPEGTIIRVPRSKIVEVKAYFHRETKTLISKLLTKHLPTLVSKLAENTKLIFSSIERIKLLKSEGNAAVLRDDIMRFIRKHSALWKSESGSHTSS